MKDEKLIKKSLELHFDALVVDQHCDIQMDMVTRRGRLENKVLERHHFPKFNQGGIDFALMSTVPHFGYEAYPFFYESDPFCPGTHRLWIDGCSGKSE